MELACGASVSVQAKGDDICLAFAKEELMTHLLKMFTKIKYTDILPEVRIILSVRKSPLLNYDGYQIVVTEKQTHITSGCARGVLHGVYHFLRLLGCSFWFSKTAVQNVPTVRRKTLETGVYSENPLINTRGLCLFGANKKTIADVLATVDFMAKNGYNLLLTSANHNDKEFGSEHDICWDEISDTVLPHLIKRGIDICLGVDISIPSSHPLTCKNFAQASEDEVLQLAENVIEYLQDKPYIKMIGPWYTSNKIKKSCVEQCDMHTKNGIFVKTIHSAREDINILHMACESVCSECPNDGMPENVAALLTEQQDAYNWVTHNKKCNGIYLIDRDMGDSYSWHTNLWLHPAHAKQIVASAANAGCEGVISLWAPISSWRIAAVNFAFLREAYYHPDYSIPDTLHAFCEDLWGAMANPMYNVLGLVIEGLQDTAIWSRPPRAPSRVSDHIINRNQIFDMQNARTIKKRCDEIREKLRNINVTRLDERGRYHLDSLKLYVELQLEFFTAVDQYSALADTPEKVEPYYQLLSKAYETVGEGFATQSYAKKVFKKKKLFTK